MTEKSRIDGTDLEAFEQVLERFGSDRTRWPAPVRRDFAGLASRDPAAKARLREAEALDRLLDLAAEPQVDTRALADRILATAHAEAKPASAQPAARVAWARGPSRGAVGGGDWPAAALLAASLVIGAVFGFNGVFDRAAAPLIAAASTEAGIDADQVAFESDSLGGYGEDLL